jgi:hypothetical protein
LQPWPLPRAEFALPQIAGKQYFLQAKVSESKQQKMSKREQDFRL